MRDAIHTILGAKGSTGKALLEELTKRNCTIRAVTRGSTIPEVENKNADLLQKDQVMEAIAGSTYVYLCIGLPYRTAVWEVQWELVMANVIDACAKHNATLIYLDNIYMYKPPLPIPFKEETPQGPASKKGQARKRTTDLLFQAINSGRIQGLVGRSADFYGKFAVNSPFYISFLERMLQGKAPQFLTNPEILHTYANIPDNARALIDLALCEDCYGQVWHLPVGSPTTANEMLTLFNQCLGTKYKIQVLPAFMRKFLALFIGPLKEVSEMLYQFEQPYLMSSEKFMNRFPAFKITTYKEGVSEMVEYFKAQSDSKSNL